MDEKSTKDFDALVADMPSLNVYTRNPQTRTERDDPKNLFGVKSLSDLSEKALERIARQTRPKPTS